jgi:uncharacterized protein GlcG (DUF336 family)
MSVHLIPQARAALLVLLLLLPSCGGSPRESDRGCDGTCEQTALTEGDVKTVVAQAVSQALVFDQRVTIAVTDRVGNVLAVFVMDGAPSLTRITSQRVPAVQGGLEGLDVPAALAAISKAGTAAYLSSQGNAFTTRTASQIVQQHFNPGERGRPGGPLFGVQFTQLPCGDLVTAFPSRTGPHRLPLGLSADPGGVPLYKTSSGPERDGAVLVGGVGVEGVVERDSSSAMAMPLYRFDPSISDSDDDLEEQIALAGSSGFDAPLARRANRIAVDGRFLRFADAQASEPDPAPSFGSLPGELILIPGFAGAVVSPGTALSSAESGILATVFEGIEAEILVDASGAARFPPRSASTPDGLVESEVRSILRHGLEIARRTRAQIRRPLGTVARVNIAVVGTQGEILGMVRARDAPVFGADTALQKARTAVFLSSSTAAEELRSTAPPRYEGAGTIADYVDGFQALLGDPDAFTGSVAFSGRAIGNLSRPFFPDGIDGNPNGPLSLPFERWSPFSTGLQLDLVFNALADVLGGIPRSECTDIPALPNGIQIFPGGVPIYRGDTLVGGIGISGDGIDQDDMIGFLAVHDAGRELGTFGNAPRAMRVDRLSFDGSNLRYVNCPLLPFVDSDEQGACDGL